MRRLHRNFRWGYTGEPQTMLTEGGRVTFRTAESAEVTADETIDHGGRTLIPAFVDAHCHILPTGLDLQKLHLGPAESHADVLDLVRNRLTDQPEGWIHAVHYDQNRYDGIHLTRDALDAISSIRPILLRHVNGHASLANTAALVAAHVDDSTPDPAGGRFDRDAQGRLTGLLLEDAHEHVTNAAPGPTFEEMVDAILRAGASMREYGISCASDMMTGRFDLAMELAAYEAAYDRGCQVAVRLYLQWKTRFGPRSIDPQHLVPFETGVDPLRPRIAGVKIFADGAIGSATAAIYGSYSGATPAGPVISSRRTRPEREGVSGQLIYGEDRLREMVRTADAAGYQVAVHSIGDYASDLVMDAFAETSDPTRHRLEHAMILSDAQIDRLAGIGCFVTFQPEFLARFGTSYRRQLGPDRASLLKRTRSLLDAGIRLSFSSDRPIVSGDPLIGIDAGVDRPAGFSAAENCTREEALRAYTEAGSLVNGDERFFGTLEAGAHDQYHLLG